MKHPIMRLITALTPALAWIGASALAMAEPPAITNTFNFEEAAREVPKPRELYPLVRQDMVPMDLMVLSDRQDRKEK